MDEGANFALVGASQLVAKRHDVINGRHARALDSAQGGVVLWAPFGRRRRHLVLELHGVLFDHLPLLVGGHSLNHFAGRRTRQR